MLFRRCRTNKDATILVDAQSCYFSWYDGLNWCVGIELQELENRLREFVDAFKKVGVELIFFYGGLSPEKKRRVWIVRRRRALAEMHTCIDIIKECGIEGGEGVVENGIPPNMGLISSFILKYRLNCKVSSSYFVILYEYFRRSLELSTLELFTFFSVSIDSPNARTREILEIWQIMMCFGGTKL